MHTQLPPVGVIAATLAALCCLMASAIHVHAVESADTQPLNRLRSAINSNNPTIAVSLFTEDAVVIQPRIGGMAQIYVGQEQISFWLRTLTAQHAQLELRSPIAYNGNHARWSETLAVDAFQQLGVEPLEIVSEAVLSGDGQIESLTSSFSPQAARALSPGRSTVQAQLPDPADAVGFLASVGLLCGGFAGGFATMLVLTRRRRRQARPSGPSRPVLDARSRAT
jgi:hypothetical protein